MTKHHAAIEANGIDTTELPKKIANRINHYADVFSTMNETIEQINSEEDEEVKKEMQANVDEAKEYLQQLDEDLVVLIEDYAKSKSQSSSADSQDDKTQTVSQETVMQTAHQNNDTDEIAEQRAAKRKKNAALLLGAFLTVVTLGALAARAQKG